MQEVGICLMKKMKGDGVRWGEVEVVLGSRDNV